MLSARLLHVEIGSTLIKIKCRRKLFYGCFHANCSLKLILFLVEKLIKTNVSCRCRGYDRTAYLGKKRTSATTAKKFPLQKANVALFHPLTVSHSNFRTFFYRIIRCFSLKRDVKLEKAETAYSRCCPNQTKNGMILIVYGGTIKEKQELMKRVPKTNIHSQTCSSRTITTGSRVHIFKVYTSSH